MTNEEAIKYGAEWDAAIAERGDDARSDARTFIRMAIEALKERKTGENSIAWHPYPAEKPTKEMFYLVTIRTEEPYEDFVTTSFFSERYNVFNRGRFVTAWAELPKPYKEVEE